MTERAPSGKRCSKCNADVGEDFFRVKEAPGVYLCADCDDARERIHLERQSARKRLAARGGILLAVFIIVMGLVVGASEFMSAKRQSRLTIDK